MKITSLPLEWFVSKLESGWPFALSRYGDGEWAAILGHSGRTRDHQHYTAALTLDLQRSLTSPWPYLHAVSPIAMRAHGDEIDAWLAANLIDVRWYDSEVFLNASIAGTLLPLIAALRTRKLLYVGPQRLRQLGRLLPLVDFVETPAHNAHAATDALLQMIRNHRRAADVVLLSCGPTANVLIDALWKYLPEHTLVDIGSLFDPYCGVASRSYMSRQNWHQLRRANFGEEVSVR